MFSITPSGLKLDLTTATPAQLTPHTIEFTACPSHSDNPMVDVEWTKNSLLHSSKFEEEKEETVWRDCHITLLSVLMMCNNCCFISVVTNVNAYASLYIWLFFSVYDKVRRELSYVSLQRKWKSFLYWIFHHIVSRLFLCFLERCRVVVKNIKQVIPVACFETPSYTVAQQLSLTR